MFSSGRSRLAPSTANALLGKRDNSLGDLDQFLKEEVEAAQMMFDAFRAIKGADGSVIDTRDWSEGTAIRVKVRTPTGRPLQFRRFTRDLTRDYPCCYDPSLTAVPSRPFPSQEIVANARAEAAHTKDEAGRSSLLLHAKRDLYLLAFDGVVDHLRRSPTPDAGAVAEAVRDIFDDVCDDWRELVEHGRQEAVDLARAASHARQAREAAEASASELYAVAKRLEEDLVAAKAENAALKQEMQVLAEEERAPKPSRKDEKAVPAKKSSGWFGGGGTKTAPKTANENTQTSNAPSGQSTPTVRSSSVKGLSVRFNEHALEEAIKSTPTAPSSVSPGVALGLRGRTAPGSPLKPTPFGSTTPLSPKDYADMVQSEAAKRNPVASEGKAPPRWAMDTASVAAKSAAAKSGGPWSSGQFGPSTPSSVSKHLARTTVSSEKTRGGTRKWTLKQLKEVIDDVCGAKARNDARRSKHRQAKETMRQHLYTYLNHKFGVKSVISDWADSIIAATDKFQDEDCDVAAFGRALRNMVDEEYLRRGKAIATTVRDMLRAYLASKHPHLNDQQLAQRHREKMDGDLFDDEWLDMVRFMYAPEEQPGIVDAVRARMDEIRGDETESREASSEDNAPGTRRRTKAEIEAARRRRERKRVPFSQFVQVCLFHGLDAREDVIAPFSEAIARLGGDSLSSGTVTEAQFVTVARRTRPELSERDVEQMLLKLDPWNNDGVTVSDLYLALVPGLADEDGDADAVTAELKKGSTVFALGGVGHGELFVGDNGRGTYEGNKFKPMYR